MTEQQKVQVNAEPARRSETADTSAPLVDIYEREDGTIVIEAELPGVEVDGVDIGVDKGVLSLEAQANVPELGEGFSCTYAGFGAERFFRAFALSDGVDRDGIHAEMADGVLTVTLPRAAAARSRKIEIKQG